MKIMTILLLALATEAAVEIVLHGFPLKPLRELATKTTFTRKLFSCGWCLSVWVGTVLYAFTMLVSPVVMYALVIQRAANVLHALYERCRKGTPRWFDEDDAEAELDKTSSPAARPDWVKA